MALPYSAPRLEDHLARMQALLRVVAHVLDEDQADDDLKTGAAICLKQALDVLDRLEEGLPVNVMATEIADRSQALDLARAVIDYFGDDIDPALDVDVELVTMARTIASGAAAGGAR
jgi:hypothetical protein